MKNSQKPYKNKKERDIPKKRKNDEVTKWKLSMKEILKGACLINGDGP